MAMVTTLFFMWGFLTCLNDILIPHLKALFDLSYAQAMLIQFTFFSAYFVFALPSGKIIEWLGYKKTMVGGLVTMGAGRAAFRSGRQCAVLSAFLAALIILAAGITALQVSANPYVAVLGPEKTASSRSESDASIQLARHHGSPMVRQRADSQRRACGRRCDAADVRR